MPSSSGSRLSTTVYSRLCWDCIAKQRSVTSRAQAVASRPSNSQRTRATRRTSGQARQLHSGRQRRQETATAAWSPTSSEPLLPQDGGHLPIRQRLAKWQEEHGNPMSDLIGLDTAFGIRNVVADSYAEPKTRNSEDLANDEDVESGKSEIQYDEELTEYGSTFLNMGDLVELRSSRPHAPPMICVFVRLIGNRQLQLMTMRGKWVAVTQDNVRFTVPKFMDARKVAPIVPFLPEAEVIEEVLGQTHILDPSVPREVTAPCVIALNQFNQASEEVYRKYASVLDKAHDALAHATDLRFGTLDRITDRLIGKDNKSVPRLAAMYAVRKALITGGMGFGIDRRSHTETGVFQIRSKEQLNYVTTAVKWLREYQEYEVANRLSPAGLKSQRKSEGARIVQSFVDKARLAIIDSRKHRSAEYIWEGGLGPSDRRYPADSKHGTLRYVAGVEFDNNDRVLIRVLEYAGVQRMLLDEESVQALLPLLIRSTGMYSQEPHAVIFAQRACFTFLIEIGVYSTFDDITQYDVNLLLPSSQHSKPLQQLASTLDRMDPSKVDLKDGYADIRKDLTNTTAFAIDSAGAHEIDDAVSVTRIPGDDAKAWLHIHIANPTAYITRDSVFARMAAHLTESYYAPDRNTPLLPTWLSQGMFSLASGRPCLTISVLLGEDGEVLDFKIEHNTIGKVVQLDHMQVSKLLGKNFQSTGLPPMVVGGELPRSVKTREEPEPEMTAESVADLKLINKFAMARTKYRSRKGGWAHETKQPDVSVYSKAGRVGLEESYPRRARSIRVDGDPIIAIHPERWSNPFDVSSESAKSVVQEMMLVAGEAFGRWCQQRDIPVPYRLMVQEPGMPTYEEAIAKYLQSSMDRYGTIPVSAGYDFITAAGKARVATTPGKHFALGLDIYTKATSPLRRYGDMIAHWQVEAALREEARHGHNSLITRSVRNHDYLPFNQPQMENIISRLHPREKLISASKFRSRRHWQTQWFFRAHYFKEYPLPPTLKVIVTRPTQVMQMRGTMNYQCVWIDTSITFKLDMWRDATEHEIRLGDVWEVEIRDVLPGFPDVYVKPIRLLEREQAR